MDLSNKVDLERHFADQLDTRLFPLLAEQYLEDDELQRAKKVCEVGLGYHPENADGWYILAKIQYELEELTETEKCLKNVVKLGRSHLQARIELAELQTMLERASSTIVSSWKKVLKLAPSHQRALDEIERLAPPAPKKPVYSPPEKVDEPIPDPEPEEIENSEPESFTKEKPEINSEAEEDVENNDDDSSVSDDDESSEIEEETSDDIAPVEPAKPGGPKDPAPIQISPRMATITLARVFKEQGLYYQALSVLDILEGKGEDLKVIELERESIKEKISTSQNSTEEL